MTDATELDEAAVRARYQRACDELDRMTQAGGGPGAAWRWSIPANPERDTDLILSDSLADLPAALDENARLRAALDEAEFHIRQLTESRDLAERSAEAAEAALAAVREVESAMSDSALKAWSSATARRGLSDETALTQHADALSRWSERIRLALATPTTTERSEG